MEKINNSRIIENQLKLDITRSGEGHDVLSHVIEKNKWSETQISPDVRWLCCPLRAEDIDEILNSKICINRYPMAHVIFQIYKIQAFARKKELSIIMEQMREYFPEEYTFYPNTYLYPEDKTKLLILLDKNASSIHKKTYILKPSSGTQGKGIKLFQNRFQLIEGLTKSKDTEFVIQEYIEKPLLLEGKKFDLRIYVLLQGINNINCYIGNEGLARFCTVFLRKIEKQEDYKEPEMGGLEKQFAHLTNYTLNKDSENFVVSDSILSQNNATKRTLTSLYQSLEQIGISQKIIQDKIKSIVLKTVIAIEPYMTQEFYMAFGGLEKNYKKCFQLFGFDILLDENLDGWLLEINAAPALSITHEKILENTEKLFEISAVDLFVKSQIIEDSLQIIFSKIPDLKSYGSFIRILPLDIGNPYEKLLLIKRVEQIFTKLQSPKICGSLNQSKFVQIAKIINGKFGIVSKSLFDITFTQIIKKHKESSMDLSLFIESLELLSEKLPIKAEKTDKNLSKSKFFILINTLYSLIFNIKI